jgi:hypothetical protein
MDIGLDVARQKIPNTEAIKCDLFVLQANKSGIPVLSLHLSEGFNYYHLSLFNVPRVEQLALVRRGNSRTESTLAIGAGPFGFLK